MANIVIIGAGMMGSAMSLPARDNNHSVIIMGTPLDDALIEHARRTGSHLTMKRELPYGIEYSVFDSDKLTKVFGGADLLICGVSSFGVDWFAETVVPIIPDRLPVIAVTKGLIHNGDGTLTPFPRRWREASRNRVSFNAIGGPCTSYELADRRHSGVVFCGDDPTTLSWIKSLLETDYYHISTSTDVDGVECAVSLKNAFALGVTLAVGLTETTDGIGCGLAYNPQAALFGQCVREMSRVLDLIGADHANLVYGLGDLYVTIYGGRTRKLGTLLGRGMTFSEAMKQLDGVTLESVVIARRIAEAVRVLAGKGRTSLELFPLLIYIDKLLNDTAPAPIPWRQFETDV
jgi:glycerol-3-phosphate dehydrogenase (NAD(P)+)